MIKLISSESRESLVNKNIKINFSKGFIILIAFVIAMAQLLNVILELGRKTDI